MQKFPVHQIPNSPFPMQILLLGSPICSLINKFASFLMKTMPLTLFDFQLQPTVSWESVHLISICSIRCLGVLFMDTHFVNREYVVDLVGEPGNIHGPDSSINGGFQSSMPSPLQISHLKEFQEPYVESYFNHQTVGSKQICGFPEYPLRSGLLALCFP